MFFFTKKNLDVGNWKLENGEKRKSYPLLITYYSLYLEVRRSWRVGADCKSVASLLSRFESCYFHKTADNVTAACRKSTLVVQVRFLVGWFKRSISIAVSASGFLPDDKGSIPLWSTYVNDHTSIVNI